MIAQCDNCESTITQTCKDMDAPHRVGTCGESVGHYFGESPRYFPNASKGDPAWICGVCYRLLRGHQGEALLDREGW
jgi:hypothetical protein